MRSLSPIGQLTQDSRLKNWWCSEPVSIPYFSGALIPFTLVVEADNSIYPPEISEAVTNFLSLQSQDRLAASERVFKNYQDFAEAAEDIDVKIEEPNKVWDSVHPTMIYVDRRHRRDQDIYITVACECDWEIEHGLQLVFRRGSKLIRISDQDGHLTHADAYNLPEDQDDVQS